MTNYTTAEQVYSRNYGSETLYKRPYCQSLSYTEGLMDFQKSLNAYWIVDNMVSYMPKILEAYNNYEFSFFMVEICLNKEHKGYMEIYTEDYVAGEYKDHIGIIKQEIEFIDLPAKVDEDFTTYKFYLELSSLKPIKFVLLLPKEH